MSHKKPHTQFYLILPQVLNPGVLRDFQGILAETPAACVLCRDPGQGGFDQELTVKFKDMAQRHEVAFLIEDNMAVAQAIGADGLHLSAEAMKNEGAYEKAREFLGEELIIGCFCEGRHQAMVVAEQYAQYIACEPPAQTVGGEADQDQASQHQVFEYDDRDLVLWSHEMLEIPTVAWNIKKSAQAHFYAAAKVDFIALGDILWQSTNPQDYIRSLYASFEKA